MGYDLNIYFCVCVAESQVLSLCALISREVLCQLPSPIKKCLCCLNSVLVCRYRKINLEGNLVLCLVKTIIAVRLLLGFI